jgi:iron complex transport system permease protein
MKKSFSTPHKALSSSKTVVVGGMVIIGICIPLSLLLGSISLTLPQLYEGLWISSSAAHLILWEVRAPRTMLALLVGAGLGLSGAVLQGLMRNPLADAALFGAPQMAALGAVLVLSSGATLVYSPLLPLVAILGACLSVGIVLLIAGQHGDTSTLLLAGLALGSLAGAATSLVLSLSPNPFAVTEIVFWMLGSFEDRSLHHVILAAPLSLVGIGLLLGMGKGLKALTLGEDTAQTLGINVTRLRWQGVVGVALCVGSGVAVSGAIGFVGLIIPHLIRAMIGADPQKILIPSMLGGALLLLCADMAVRAIPAQAEIKVGVLTALIGVPFFLMLVLKVRTSS